MGDDGGRWGTMGDDGVDLPAKYPIVATIKQC
jgi:hypothetical protein